MTMTKALGAISGAAMIALVGPAWAAGDLELNKPGELSVCVVDASAPMASVIDGEMQGYEISFTKEVASRLGLKPEYRITVFEGIFAAAANHVCDISAGSHSITIKRKEIINFSSPHFVGSYTILSPSDSGIADEKGLAGKRLGVVAATIQETYANETYKDTEIVPFPDSAAMQLSLQSGQIDAAFFDGGLAAIYIKTSPKPLSVVVSIPNTDQPAGIGVAKDRPNLLAAVNQAIADMIADGTYAKIYKEWIGEEVPDLPGPDFVPTR
ncbi:MAG TPA: ABC transporter substrate-binding protein [Bauldia sp.]|nr:ABC transporter substrate-binding protein [Bauldia sp.]